MLPRVLEPEVMDTLEEATDYDQMDHSGVNRAFVADLLAAGPVPGDLLDLGTGTAQIPILLCEQTDDCRVFAVDMSVSMLDQARYNIEIAGLIERIFLQQIDAKKTPFADNLFDSTVSNSIVHHLPDPVAAIREAVRVTKPGGRIFFRDLFRPETDAEVEQLVQTYAGRENEHAQKMFDDSLRAALRVDEFQAIVAELGFDPGTVAATSDRHWTWNAIKPEI
ncbi:class I SAM-dependent methyltransferase [Lignipirellula cremea]|uniref:Demethylrebeccamycin-D-glucose O-methyltransferase n=1 Tax=Lignipirellula cremea TaxID=2528010 RepID=A0A518DWT9_9BACT|nr:class I SAM-dependent methyltransferase [Lignipirellula cremea]QDU96284.1 Demethylrebeccamycin-D-glucose O-methyltransferase [Lignipirellula cremea]